MSRRNKTVPLLALGLTSALGTGCVHARDFSAPGERMTAHTAYAEHDRVRLDVDMLGPDAQTLVVNAGVTVTAIRDHLDFSINLAHGGMGVVNIQSKFTFFESRWYAVGGRTAFTYLNPATFWFLPKELRQELGGINMASVPIELWNSFPIIDWFSFDVGLGYTHGFVWGGLDVDGLLLESNVSKRQFNFMPTVRFYVAKRVALVAGAQLPAFSQTVSEIDGTYEVDPDVLVGVRSVEWFERKFGDSVRAQIAAETRFGKNTHLRLGVNIGSYRPLDVLIVTPSFKMYWRWK